MIAVRLADHFSLAGFDYGEDRVVPVVGYTPPDVASRDEVIRWHVGYLRRRLRHLSDDEFRARLREAGGALARHAEDASWPAPELKRGLMLREAEELVGSGDAEPIMPDLSALDRGELPWS